MKYCVFTESKGKYKERTKKNQRENSQSSVAEKEKISVIEEVAFGEPR